MTLRTRILSLRDGCDLNTDNGYNVVRFEAEFKVCSTAAVEANDPDRDGCEFFDREGVDDLVEYLRGGP